jgi:acyl-CoA synthetase (NDP forming)
VRDLTRMFNPRSICVVGASLDPSKVSGRIVPSLRRNGYTWPIFAVTRSDREHAGDVQVCDSISGIDSFVDLAVIILRPEAAIEAVIECAQQGIRNIMILSSGFEEVAENSELVSQLRSAIKAWGLTVLGPNSEGLIAVPNNLVVSIGSAGSAIAMHEGPVSVLSQSGSVGAAVVSRLDQWEVGIRYFVSVGNESDLDILDYLDYVIEEGGTRVCGLFVEGLTAGHRLGDIARRARRADVTLVALKAGRSAGGRAATLTHTGKMSSAGSIYSSVFTQLGVLEVTTVSELAEACAALASSRPSRPVDPAVVSFGGGARALLIDAFNEFGVEPATLMPSTREHLAGLLSALAVIDNPIDPGITVVQDSSVFVKVMRSLLGDAAVGSVLAQFPNWPGPRILEYAAPHLECLAQMRQEYQKPIIFGALAADLDSVVRQAFFRRGLPLYRDPMDAARALKWIQQAGALDATSEGASRVESETHPGVGSPGQLTTRRLLRWQESAELIKAIGIPVAAGEIITSANELENCVTNHIQGPVALKLIDTGLAHKTEHGHVVLGLTSPDAAAAVFRDFSIPTGAGVLVQQMYQGVEVCLSGFIDRDLGPIVAVSEGGVMVERSSKRASYLSCPVQPAEVETALARAELNVVLDGYRGAAPADSQALIEAIVRLAEFMSGSTETDAEIELNPVIVLPRGDGIVAVDIVFLRSTAEDG